MTSLAADRIREMGDLLARKLVELNPDVILAINNASYHAFRLMTSEPTSGLRSFRSRLRHLNAVAYLAPGHSAVLFVSELEYGRSLREATSALSAASRRSIPALALLENGSADVRRARAKPSALD